MRLNFLSLSNVSAPVPIPFLWLTPVNHPSFRAKCRVSFQGHSSESGEGMVAWRGVCILFVALMTTGCAGLKQFPDTATDFKADLIAKDPAYATALDTMAQSGADKVAIRNRMIEERLRVIDLRFGEFQRALSRENVTANFGIATAQIVIGGAGALVHETASQILSAISGALAGTQQAYSKAALFEQTMSALLAQMIAARNSVLVKIVEGRGKGIDEYPLSAAARDLEAYYFAGSLPGAIVATSADAKVKNDAAETKLDSLRSNVFNASESKTRIQAFIFPPDGDTAKPSDAANLKSVQNWIESSSVKDLPIANFLTNKDLEELRTKMIRDLSIPQRR